MPPFISETRARRLQGVLRTALSPLNRGDWYRDVLVQTMDLVGAGVGTLFDPSRPGVLHSTGDEGLMRPYVEYFHHRERAVPEMVRRRMEVGHPALVGRPDERADGEFVTDFLRPNGLLDLFCINTYAAEAPATRMMLSMHHRTDDAELEREVLLLGMVAPAFRAGLEAVRLADACAGALGRTLDRLPGALAVCWGDGAVEHRNAALQALLQDEPEAGRLMEEVRRAGAQVGAALQRGAELEAGAAPGERMVSTDAARYRLRATGVEEGVLGPRMMVLVSVARNAGRPLTDAQLRERYQLTPREIQAARLLGRGLRNAELARELGVSEHTARHHTERVFQKMGLTTRAQMGPLLLNGG